MSDSASLKGKTAVVTGSTSGIGAAIARRLAANGASVMLNGLGDDARIEVLQGEIGDLGAGDVDFNSADMRKPDEITAMIHATAERFGSVDILVNNAGIQHVAPINEFPAEKWNEIIAVNLSSSFHTTRAVIPYMLTAGWGRIVNIASLHALVASPYKCAYVAAKHGLAGLTKTAALELARSNVTVNAIAPGYVDTPLVRDQVADTAKARGISEQAVVDDVMLAAQPTKRFISMEEIAGLALFLCSDQAASITGAVLPVDGGWSAQ